MLYQVLKPIEAIGARPGDFVVVRPGMPHPFLLERKLNPSVESLLSDESVLELVYPRGDKPPPGGCALRLEP